MSTILYYHLGVLAKLVRVFFMMLQAVIVAVSHLLRVRASEREGGNVSVCVIIERTTSYHTLIYANYLISIFIFQAQQDQKKGQRKK